MMCNRHHCASTTMIKRFMKALDGHVLTPVRIHSWADRHRRASACGRHWANRLQGWGRDSAPIVLIPGFVDFACSWRRRWGRRDGWRRCGTEGCTQVHVQHGTTTMLATTNDRALPMTCALPLLALPPRISANGATAAAHIHGVHLEGPFIVPASRAQPDFTRRPISLAEVQALHAAARRSH